MVLLCFVCFFLVRFLFFCLTMLFSLHETASKHNKNNIDKKKSVSVSTKGSTKCRTTTT